MCYFPRSRDSKSLRPTYRHLIVFLHSKETSILLWQMWKVCHTGWPLWKRQVYHTTRQQHKYQVYHSSRQQHKHQVYHTTRQQDKHQVYHSSRQQHKHPTGLILVPQQFHVSASHSLVFSLFFLSVSPSHTFSLSLGVPCQSCGSGRVHPALRHHEKVWRSPWAIGEAWVPMVWVNPWGRGEGMCRPRGPGPRHRGRASNVPPAFHRHVPVGTNDTEKWKPKQMPANGSAGLLRAERSACPRGPLGESLSEGKDRVRQQGCIWHVPHCHVQWAWSECWWVTQ